MKKFIAYVGIVISLVSCQITESYYMSETGTVRMQYEVDFTQIMGMMADERIDSLREIGEYPIDSVISFKNILSTMTKEELDTLNESDKKLIDMLKNAEFRIQINDESSSMSMDSGEKSVEDFNLFIKEFEKVMNEKTENQENNSFIPKFLGKTELSYNGKQFSKKMIMKESEERIEDADTMDLFSSLITYKQEYHFPKKIKNTNVQDATISLDGKTMVIEFPSVEAYQKLEEIRVELEKR